MAKRPATNPAAKALEAAAKPAELVGQALDRAFEPVTTAFKRATQRREPPTPQPHHRWPAADQAALRHHQRHQSGYRRH